MNVFGYYVLEGILLLVSAAIPAVFVCANMQMADLTVHTLMEPAWGLFCFVCVGHAVVGDNNFARHLFPRPESDGD